MSQTDYVDFEPKSANDRTVMHILYGMHTIAWASMGTLAVIALIVNYIKRSDEPDLIFAAHHTYMINTFWWTILWLAVTSVLYLLFIWLTVSSPMYLLFFIPGAFAWTVIGLWYLYRCIKGWLRFNDNRAPL